MTSMTCVWKVVQYYILSCCCINKTETVNGISLASLGFSFSSLSHDTERLASTDTIPEDFQEFSTQHGADSL